MQRDPVRRCATNGAGCGIGFQPVIFNATGWKPIPRNSMPFCKTRDGLPILLFSDGLEVHPTANYGNCFKTIPKRPFRLKTQLFSHGRFFPNTWQNQIQDCSHGHGIERIARETEKSFLSLGSMRATAMDRDSFRSPR